MSPFLLRGGLKLRPADALFFKNDEVYRVVAVRELGFAAIVVAGKMVGPVEVKFVNPLVLRGGCLVFEVDAGKKRRG